MRRPIVFFLCAVLCGGTSIAGPRPPSNGKFPSILIGEVNGKQLLLHLLPEGSVPELRKLKGTRSINVEEGCIMVEAYVSLIGEGLLEIRMPHEDPPTKLTMLKMGVSTKSVVVKFESSDAPNLAGAIKAITPITPDPSESGPPGD
jgi:hypothetical protein